MKKGEIRLSREGSFFYPEYSEWDKLITGFSRSGKIEEMKWKLREEILSSLGLERRLKEKKWILVGHQPVLFHPGVWSKLFVLDDFARQIDGFPLFVLLDNVVEKEISAYFLHKEEDRLKRVHEVFIKPPDGSPLEVLKLPQEKEVVSFIKRVDSHLDSLSGAKPQKNWSFFRELAIDTLRDSVNLPDFLNNWREKGEDINYHCVNLSIIASGEVFWEFFYEIYNRADTFFEIYNRVLKKIREERKIRTDLQPFPDLRKPEGKIELPFWSIYGGRRKRIYRKGTHIIIDEEKLYPDRKTLKNLRIRPRAVTLSLFLRLYLSDLFIHGIGGGKYQEVVDSTAEEFYGTALSPFSICTLSIGILLNKERRGHRDLVALRETLNRMEHHPEKFLSKTLRGKVKELIKEKERLIKDFSRRDTDKRPLTRRVKEINAILYGYLDRERTALEKSLDNMEVLSFREYPFLLFSSKELRDAIFR